MDGNDQKCLELLEISEIGWTWLECLKIADNGWKCTDDVKHLNPSLLTSFVQHKNFEVLFLEVWRIQIQICTQSSIEPKLVAFYFKKEKNKSVYHSKVFLGHLR